MFESITLVRSGAHVADIKVSGQGVAPWWEDDAPTVADGRERYWLFLMLRSSAVDTQTLEPIRRELSGHGQNYKGGLAAQIDAPTNVTGVGHGASPFFGAGALSLSRRARFAHPKQVEGGSAGVFNRLQSGWTPPRSPTPESPARLS